MHIRQLIGGAGTGKTTRNMEAIEVLIADGVDPMEILFSSFTRAARQTAATRAEDITGVDAKSLMQDGWFRTLQSICYRCLGIKSDQMITDKKSSRDWLADVFQSDFSKTNLDSEDGYVVEDDSKNPINCVLREWSNARMALITADDDRWPVKSMERNKAISIIEQYEKRKRVDDRLDFADLALHFVGIRHEVHTLIHEHPRCETPDVVACIFDEYQDTPELLHLVAKRIVEESPRVRQVWCSGDPFQSIFSFSGASHRWLMSGWNYNQHEVMQQSFRCSRSVLELGERTIQRCSDYFDRGIASREVEGSVLRHTSDGKKWKPDPTEDWLVVGRTNYAVTQISKWLSLNNIPWISADGDNHGYVGPRKRRIGKVFHAIQNRQPINGNDWAYAIGDIPVSFHGNALLKRGVKTAANSTEWQCPDEVTFDQLTRHGATDHLLEMLQRGDWSAFDPAYKVFQRVASIHGIDLALKPKIRAGTIHGVKGDEADNVLLYTKLSGITESSMNNKITSDEEFRIWYVGITRARDNLVLFRFDGDRAAFH